MATEAAAAKAGGIGTLCDMPNTVPPTTTVMALADKVRRASQVEDCDIRFFFGVTQAEHLRTLIDLWTGDSEELQRLKKSCCGVKLYLDHSTGNQKVEEELLEEIFTACAQHGIQIIAHCEDPKINAAAAAAVSSKDVSAHSQRRPPEAEVESVRKALALAGKTGAHFHVAHLSTAGALDLVRAAKKQKNNVTCEVAPHHLFMTTDDYATLGTLAKVNPPLRSTMDRNALWEGLSDGTIDCVSTDHAPHTLEEKQSGAPLDAPSGMPGTQFVLPLLLTVVNGGWPHPTSQKPSSAKLTLEDIERLMFASPNMIFGLGKSPSDQIQIDMDAHWEITKNDILSKCGWSPYEGWNVVGRVR